MTILNFTSETLVSIKNSIMVAKKIIFSGRVQGVFFRAFVKKQADTLGVKGYVKNMDDGTVEAVFEGEKNAVDKLIEICRKGTTSAHIENVKIEAVSVKPHQNFDIAY